MAPSSQLRSSSSSLTARWALPHFVESALLCMQPVRFINALVKQSNQIVKRPLTAGHNLVMQAVFVLAKVCVAEVLLLSLSSLSDNRLQGEIGLLAVGLL